MTRTEMTTLLATATADLTATVASAQTAGDAWALAAREAQAKGMQLASASRGRSTGETPVTRCAALVAGARSWMERVEAVALRAQRLEDALARQAAMEPGESRLNAHIANRAEGEAVAAAVSALVESEWEPAAEAAAQQVRRAENAVLAVHAARLEDAAAVMQHHALGDETLESSVDLARVGQPRHLGKQTLGR